MNIDGFSKPNTKTTGRLILSLVGLEKTGRSTIALSSPGDIAYIDINEGTEGIIEGYPNVWRKRYNIKAKYRRDKTACQEACAEIDEDYDAMLHKEPTIRTIVCDTWNEYVTMYRIGQWGRAVQPPEARHKYAEVNPHFDEFILKAFNADKNVVLINEAKEKYVNDKWDGVSYKRDGYNSTAKRVQAEVWTYKSADTPPNFTMRITDSRFKGWLTGKEITNIVDEDNGKIIVGGMPELLALFHGGSEEDWK
jgi:hypothetical protein